MKVTGSGIVFENQRDKDIFGEILREVNIGEIRPEIAVETMKMLDELTQGQGISLEPVEPRVSHIEICYDDGKMKRVAAGYDDD